MIVFDLKCAQGHVFEAWFASSAAFADQQARKLIICPLCGNDEIVKAAMTPNIPVKGNKRTEVVPVASAAPTDADTKRFLAFAAAVQARMLENSQWVGREFASKARAMDAGEVPHEAIHGEVTREEAKALIEDGVGVMPLPFPVIAPDKRN